jgi:hypothetical protein
MYVTFLFFNNLASEFNENKFPVTHISSKYSFSFTLPAKEFKNFFAHRCVARTPPHQNFHDFVTLLTFWRETHNKYTQQKQKQKQKHEQRQRSNINS